MKKNNDQKTLTCFEQITTKQGLNKIVSISNDIWNEYYIPIFGKDKVEFILTNLLSKKAIIEKIKKHKHYYYLIKYSGNDVGYIGVQLRTKDLLISNLYICPKHRGLRIGREAINLARKIAKKNKYNAITIRVNKENLEAIIATHRLGFKKVGEVCRNIGGAYIMDDLVMEIIVNEENNKKP